MYKDASVFLDRKKLLADDCIKNASCRLQISDETRITIVEDYYNGMTGVEMEEKYNFDRWIITSSLRILGKESKLKIRRKL